MTNHFKTIIFLLMLIAISCKKKMKPLWYKPSPGWLFNPTMSNLSIMKLDMPQDLGKFTKLKMVVLTGRQIVYQICHSTQYVL
jgi:hypothetical protein